MIETIKKFKKAGEPTECTPIDFVSAIREQLPVLQLSTPEDIQKRYSEQFESYDRYEYIVKDGDSTLAIMVIVQEYDITTGCTVVNSLHTASIKPNLLSSAYRWMKQIAKRSGVPFIVLSRFKEGGYSTEAKLIRVNAHI